MTKKRIFTYIFPSYLLLIIIPIACITWIFSRVMYNSYQEMIKDKQASVAVSISPLILQNLRPEHASELNRLVKRLAKETSMRVTVIDTEGIVLAESARDVLSMENHANRPEIISAANGKPAFSSRYSATLTKETMYYAVPLEEQGTPVAILRTAVTLNSLDRAMQATYSNIIFIGIMIAMIAIGTAFFISRKFSAPLEKLKNIAADLAQGNFAFKPLRSNIVEIDELSASIKVMSDSLQERINEINEQKDELKLILGNMREGVIAVDLEDNIITINAAAKQILNTQVPIADVTAGTNKLENALIAGIPTVPEDSKLHSFKETIRTKALHDFVADLLVENKFLQRKVELVGLQKKIIDVHGAVLKDIQGESIGVLMVLNDITKLTELENMRKNFAANVSHELKTPLTAIKGAVETLMDGAMDSREDARKFLQIISKHSDRLTSLINDTMSLSRIEQETEQERIFKERIKLMEAIETSVEVCREKAEARHVTLKTDCNKKIEINANLQMLEQALVNLIDNAIKFSPEYDIVSITVSSTQKFVTINVTDHGCGVAEKHIPHLFERFYRVDKGRSRQQGGTGLGLSIVKHIAQSHDGAVSVDSDPNIETTFSIKLPF